MLQASKETSYVSGRRIKRIEKFDAKEYQSLNKIGISLDGINGGMIRRMMSNVYAMDSTQYPVTSPSIPTPVQFLQEWLPGFVNVITKVRRIDEIVGIMVAGAWEDEEIVQGFKELLNAPQPYGDINNIPLVSNNVNFEKRSNVRFEQGLMVSILEEKQASRIRISAAAEKRASVTLGLEIIRNQVGFYGYNNGNNLTFGFLNDPFLLPAVAAPNGASGFPLWSTKTYLEIVADIKQMCQTLQTQSQGNIDPLKDETTLVVPNNEALFLTQSTDFGYSVKKWITEDFPRMRIISAPELDTGSSTGISIAYLFADAVDDSFSSDGSRTFIQVVPNKFMTLGVQTLAKGYKEDYSNATAGTWCKRPWAVTRLTGI
jgi:hypothetical protein